MNNLIIMLTMAVFSFCTHAGMITLKKTQRTLTEYTKEVIIEDINKESPRIVFMGETYNNLFVKKISNQIIREFVKQSNKKVCLFMELSNSYQHAFDLLNNYKIFDAIRAYYKDSDKTSAYAESLSGKALSDWTNWVALENMVFDGIKVYAIDIKNNKQRLRRLNQLFKIYYTGRTTIPEMNEFEKLLLEHPNNAMVTNANMILNSSDYNCEIAFFPVGSGHLDKKADLPEMLKQNFKTMELIFGQKSTYYKKSRNCKEVDGFHYNICIDMDN